jgi:4-aminobutyrate aminotransferase
MLATAELVDAWPPASHGSTFGGNPIACRAGLATLRIVQEEDLMAHAVELGDHIQSRFCEAQKELPMIGDVRGKGLMVGIELVRPDGSPAGETVKTVIKEIAASGLVLTKCGISSLRIAPPLIITQEQASQGVDIIIQVLRRNQW